MVEDRILSEKYTVSEVSLSKPKNVNPENESKIPAV
jgi:hypothetical protein